MKKSEKIRRAYEQIGPEATNEEIKHQCNKQYRFVPSSQLVYSVCGTETERLLIKFNGKQIKQVADICRTSFNNNFNDLRMAVVAANQLSHV